MWLCFQDCRPVFCEGNHLVSKHNSCPDSDVKILSEEFGLCLNITFNPPISLNIFQQIMSNFSNQLPMWKNLGLIDWVYYKIKNETVAYAIATMSIQRNKRSYKIMIKGIKRGLAYHVIAMVNEKEIQVIQHISDYCEFSLSNHGKFIPSWTKELLNKNGYEHILRPSLIQSEFIFEILKFSTNGRFISISKPQITKLSFCRQVELKKHEATVVEDVVLYVNLTGRLVFDFVATRDLDTADVLVRVCLEDFPFDELRMSSASSYGFDFLMFCSVHWLWRFLSNLSVG